MIDSTTHQFSAITAAAVPPASGPYDKRQQLLQDLMGNGDLLLKNRLEVRHLMTLNPATILPNATLQEITGIMQRRRLHHLLVCGRGGDLMGVVSDRDLAASRGTTAQQLMSYPPRTCSPDTPLGAAITFLLNENISCLPVVEEGQLRGVLTSTDLVLTLQCMIQLWMRLAQVLQHDRSWSGELDRIAGELKGDLTAGELAERISAAQSAIRQQVQDLVNRIDLRADVLTGIGNRRELEDVLDVFQGLLKRFGRPFSLAVVAIDYFDRIRARGGEAVVRPLLKTVARMIDESVRQGDFVARLRDDAFAVVLPETSVDDAGELCRRLQESARKNTQLDVELRITAGAVEARPDEDVSQLIARAEEARA